MMMGCQANHLCHVFLSFGRIFIFMILSFGSRMKRSEEPRVWASRNRLCELDFNRSDLPDIARRMRRLRLFFAVMPTVAVGGFGGVTSPSHTV